MSRQLGWALKRAETLAAHFQALKHFVVVATRSQGQVAREAFRQVTCTKGTSDSKQSQATMELTQQVSKLLKGRTTQAGVEWLAQHLRAVPDDASCSSVRPSR